jgi:hypothetical protein
MMVFAMPRLKYKVMDAASKAHLHARMLIQVLNRMRMQALHPPLLKKEVHSHVLTIP